MCVDMLDCNLCSTLMAFGPTLSLYDREPFSDPSLYCSIAGALQYYTLTKHNIYFSVTKVCRFMHAQTLIHWQVVKRISDFPKPQVLMVFLFKLTMIYLFLVILMSIGLVALITSTILVGTTLFLVLISFHGHFQSRRLCLTPITNLNIGDSLINVVAKVTWIESVLRELRVSLPQPPILLCDNISATHLDKPC